MNNAAELFELASGLFEAFAVAEDPDGTLVSRGSEFGMEWEAKLAIEDDAIGSAE